MSEAGFIAAQDASAPRGPAGTATRRYLLAGLLACGVCGRRLESAWSNGKPAYRCRRGGTPKPRRDELVTRFQSDGGPPIFLLSLKAGGTGLNLTADSHVIHLDRWWNPAVENQATDRAFRIGQTRNVQVRSAPGRWKRRSTT